MKTTKLFALLLSAFTMASCNSNQIVENSTSIEETVVEETKVEDTKVEEANESTPNEELTAPDGEFIPFDFELDNSFQSREMKALLYKSVYEDIEMKTKSFLHEIPFFSENANVAYRPYDNTYVHWIEHNNNNIYCEITYPKNFDSSKQYTTIVFSHGFMSGTTYYSPYIEKLSNEEFIFINFDYRGVNSLRTSDGSIDEFDMDTMVGDLKAVTCYAQNLPYVDTNNMYLVAHSLGGTAAAITITSPFFEDVYNGVALLSPAINMCNYYAETYSNGNNPDYVTILGVKVQFDFVTSCIRHTDIVDNAIYYPNNLFLATAKEDTIIYNDDSYAFAEALGDRATTLELSNTNHSLNDTPTFNIVCEGIRNLIHTTHRTERAESNFTPNFPLNPEINFENVE